MSDPVPAVFVSPGDMNMTPNQIRDLQDSLNQITGDLAWKHKIIVLPPGTKIAGHLKYDRYDDFELTWPDD